MFSFNLLDNIFIIFTCPSFLNFMANVKERSVFSLNLERGILDLCFDDLIVFQKPILLFNNLRDKFGESLHFRFAKKRILHYGLEMLNFVNLKIIPIHLHNLGNWVCLKSIFKCTQLDHRQAKCISYFPCILSIELYLVRSETILLGVIPVICLCTVVQINGTLSIFDFVFNHFSWKRSFREKPI